MNIADLRREYSQRRLSRQDLNTDPFEQFRQWFQEASEAEIPEPNAMSLATVSESGSPSLRTVLLKIFDHRGFVFFSNYGSRKAQQIAKNPNIAIHFLWVELERQIKIEGKASKISTAESLAYFRSRPRGSQIGAWCSEQSRIIDSREVIEKEFESLNQRFQTGEIPLPDFWGGYRMVPHRFEFWQGRPNRLHDCFLYSQQADRSWEIQRLAP